MQPGVNQKNSGGVKAVGLVSGGLDSFLAAKVIHDLGIEVHGVHFLMPWGCGNDVRAVALCRALKIPYQIFRLGEDYLELLQSPKFGYGRAFNPCVDCHIYMIRKAAEYMRQIGADFVFTGEVVGQRPMSQRRECLTWVDQESGLEGRLLRPLCAKLLPPTVPELAGMVDRRRLLEISGRGRRVQLELAKEFGLDGFSAPGGGCLLTFKHFTGRLKDVLELGYRDIRDTVVLKWGRYFRLSPQHRAILGRDEPENLLLTQNAFPDDYLLRFGELNGPTLLLQGEGPTEEIFSVAAGLVQRYSKHKHDEPLVVDCWQACSPQEIRKIKAARLTQEQIDQMVR